LICSTRAQATVGAVDLGGRLGPQMFVKGKRIERCGGDPWLAAKPRAASGRA
jgi:hypothetical protein